MTTNIEHTATTPLRALAIQELKLLDELGEARAQADAAEGASGAAYLNGDGSLLAESVRLRSLVAMIGHALAALRRQRRETIQQQIDAECQSLRERARGLRAEAEQIAGQAAPLLEQLGHLQEAEYRPLAVSRSDRLLGTVSELEARASELQRRGVPTAGNVQLDGSYSDEQIAIQALEHPSDGPTAQQLLDWIAAQPRHAEFARHRLSVRLTWQGPEIARGPLNYVRLLEPLQMPQPPQPEEPAGNRILPDAYLGGSARPRRLA
jgi:alpha-D-ribose 1-methylphosphonate 5-triphosphate synthase subunit PhnG